MFDPLFFSVALAEQQRIVGVLDEVFAGLANAQANAEKNLHGLGEPVLRFAAS